MLPASTWRRLQWRTQPYQNTVPAPFLDLLATIISFDQKWTGFRTLNRHPIYRWNQIRKEPLIQDVKRSRFSYRKATKSSFSRPAHASTSVSLSRNLLCVPMLRICRILLVCHAAGRAKELSCWYLIIASSTFVMSDINNYRSTTSWNPILSVL